ncbi:hypothetical protein F5H01DRAFT_353890 [Linnemannia elongata]|nr:hypothetical protein F5H01DRAFT_353890 [Linnemannia elongata]
MLSLDMLSSVCLISLASMCNLNRLLNMRNGSRRGCSSTTTRLINMRAGWRNGGDGSCRDSLDHDHLLVVVMRDRGRDILWCLSNDLFLDDRLFFGHLY